MKPRILVVDDESSMREFLEIFLTREGYEVTTAPGGKAAMELLDSQPFDLVITDIKMPNVSGMQVLLKAKAVDPNLPVLMITAFASHDTAVEAMKNGAFDYIVKPFKVDEIRLLVFNALERRDLSRENIALKQQLGQRYGFDNLIGSDPRMLETYDLIKRVADTPTNILITGETGTGKELVARAIHANGSRAKKAFVVINCGAIPAELLESELFGHKKGSFTGAYADKHGLLEIADGGTIFLDEVGELPTPLQVKLLRALQERRIMPVGAVRDVPIDVRVISATNRDLEKAVQDGRFRDDLYYRLNVIQIRMPALRERRVDIPILAEFFLEKYNRLLKKNILKIAEETMACLQKYRYPGNVRELENIIERAVALERENVIMKDSLPPHLLAAELANVETTPVAQVTASGLDLDRLLDETERDLLKQALQLSHGSKKGAAKLLHISFRSLRYRLAKHNFDVADDDETDSIGDE
ncbi:MAG: sigma-54-dependent Fis family transcriptional regulator [Myxococcales bacterium]|nr:sigma-54-dependent Fis family transcriptional regulator [Myxococcales bacterium]